MLKAKKDSNLSAENELSKSIFDKFLSNNLRMSIFLLLRLYDELNVTEVSHFLNKSKATVGRHLKAMKKAFILEAEERASNRTINPIYYRISDPWKKYLEYDKPMEKRGDIANKIKILKENHSSTRLRFKNEFIALQTIINLLKHSVSLLNPFLEFLNLKLHDSELDIDYLAKYLLIDNHISLKHYTLSEDILDDFYKLHYEFREKLEQLIEKGSSQKTLLFVDSILPLKELLRLAGNVNSED